MKKILVTPRSFGAFNKEEMLNKLEQHGINAEFNETGRPYTEEEMIEKLRDKDGIIVGIDPLNANVLKACEHLKVIAKYGVGVDNIDMDIAKNKEIVVTRTVGANSAAVGEYAFTLMLAVARNAVEINNKCKHGDFKKITSLDVYGKKVGVVGLGAIGREFIKRAQGFNMDIYGYDAYLDEDYIKENNITVMDVDTMMKEMDVITLHLPLTDETKYMIHAGNLATAKKDLILINTARGGLIDEDALYEYAKDHKIYGAGIDAFEVEPPVDSKLLTLENIIVGSHTAASTRGSTIMMSEMSTNSIIENLEV